MGFVRCLVAAVAISTCFCVRPAAADEDEPPPPIPPHRIVYENLFGGRVNPLGLENQYALSYKARFYDGGDSLALRENGFGIGISPTISPAITRFGGHIEVRPLTVLALQGGFYQVGYLGSFGSLQSFPDASFDYSDTALDELEESDGPRKNYPENGFEVHLRALGLAKLGPVAFRSDTNAYYTDVSLRSGDTVYYHPRVDLLMPDKGWGLTSDEDVAYVSDFGLVAGARYSVADSFVDGPDDPSATMRLGPLIAYTFFDEPGTSFNRPTLIGIFQWWLVHPYRTGEDTSQGLPYIALAFRFDGELWRSD
jgi:hypothetical protein